MQNLNKLNLPILKKNKKQKSCIIIQVNKIIIT